MTQCCNQLDVCYDTCGTSKYDCDSKFRSCLHGICSDLNKSLGFVNRVQGEIFAHIFPFSHMCTLETEVWIWAPEINSFICYSALLLSLLLCVLLSLWDDGRHSLQHSVDSGLQILHEQPEGSVFLRGRGEGWTVTYHTMDSWVLILYIYKPFRQRRDTLHEPSEDFEPGS